MQISCSNTTLSIPQFYQLENAGCVFLPCVYYTNNDATSISNVGYYWELENWGTRILFTGSHEGQIQGETAFKRLVKEYTPPTDKK